MLADLGALDGRAASPAHGRALAALPLHPRLGHMLLRAGPEAAPLAALLAERDPLRGAPPDLALRLAALRDPGRFEAEHPLGLHRPTVERIRDEARRLARGRAASGGRTCPLAEMAALAYPDRIGLRRPGEAPRWLLSGGKGAVMEPGLPLSGARLIVATDLDGDPREAGSGRRRRSPRPTCARCYADRIALARCLRLVAARAAGWWRAGRRGSARWCWPTGPGPTRRPRPWRARRWRGCARSACPGPTAARRLRARIELARGGGADLPDCTDAGLLARAEDWLLPHLGKRRTEADLRALDLTEPLRAVAELGADADAGPPLPRAVRHAARPPGAHRL